MRVCPHHSFYASLFLFINLCQSHVNARIYTCVCAGTTQEPARSDSQTQSPVAYQRASMGVGVRAHAAAASTTHGGQAVGEERREGEDDEGREGGAGVKGNDSGSRAGSRERDAWGEGKDGGDKGVGDKSARYLSSKPQFSTVRYPLTQTQMRHSDTETQIGRTVAGTGKQDSLGGGSGGLALYCRSCGAPVKFLRCLMMIMCAAVYCSALQCGVVWCSMMQCVAVYCVMMMLLVLLRNEKVWNSMSRLFKLQVLCLQNAALDLQCWFAIIFIFIGAEVSCLP